MKDDTPIVPEFRDDLDLPSHRVVGGGGTNTRSGRWSWIYDLVPAQGAVLRASSREEMVKLRGTLSSTAHRIGKKTDRQFTVRTLKPDPETGEFRFAIQRIDGTPDAR